MQDIIKVPKLNLNFINDDLYAPSNGCFGILFGKSIEWESCREGFQEEFNCNHFLYWCKEGCADRVIKFMERVQNDLGLKRSRLKFYKTSSKRVIYIVTSKFWRTELRWSFMSAALRAGEGYERGNYKQAMRKAQYFDGTAPAVEKFLDGYTRLGKNMYDYYGWYDFFCDKTEEELKGILIK